MGRSTPPNVTLPPFTAPEEPAAQPALRSGDATLPSADVASPKAIAELLVLDEHARLNKLCALFLIFLPLSATSVLLFDGGPTITWIYAGMCAVAFVATAVQYRTFRPGWFRLGRATGLLVVQMLSVVAATAYFGVFSTSVMVPVFLTFFLAQGNYAVFGLVAWLVNALGRIALVAAIASGALADPGVINGDHLSANQMANLEMIVQLVFAIAFFAGRIAHRSTSTKLTWLLDLVRQAARRELDIASNIQTTILPRDLEIPSFEASASMLPASEVGGDYYDLRPTPDGCWVGIGDVSGHGLSAGLIMMMVQTSVAALTKTGTYSITEIVEGVNHVVHDNVRRRLRKDDFVTFSLLRLTRDGRVIACGRHEPILVHRARTGAVEMFDPEGLWLGLRPSLGHGLTPIELVLERGDTLVLHTDGVTEAGNATRERFGIQRLTDSVKHHAALPVPALREALEREVVAFSAPQTDDITLVVIRYAGA